MNVPSPSFCPAAAYRLIGVNRRRFLAGSATAGATALGLQRPARGAVDFNLVDEVGYSVIESLDDNWNRDELEEEMADVLDTACYAYGKVTTESGDTSSREAGYLARLGDLTWERLKTNPEAFDWLFDYVDKISHFVGALDVFPERIADTMDEVANMATEARRITKFVPLFWSVKGVLDSGCHIHNLVDAGREVTKKAYLRFFKHVALVIVELLLLAAGVGVAYKAAFRATGGVNSLLINVVGRRIGWQAYSWVLSLVHWGIRVVFAGGMDEAISETTGAVVDELVEASPLGRSQAESIAEEDVRKVAAHSDGLLDRDYWWWKQKRESEQLIESAEERAEKAIDSLPFT